MVIRSSQEIEEEIIRLKDEQQKILKQEELEAEVNYKREKELEVAQQKAKEVAIKADIARWERERKEAIQRQEEWWDTKRRTCYCAVPGGILANYSVCLSYFMYPWEQCSQCGLGELNPYADVRSHYSGVPHLVTGEPVPDLPVRYE